MESLSFLFGKQTIGPSRMVPVLVLAGVLLCLMVTGVCILLTSRLTGRITATLKTLRQAADNLRDGELISKSSPATSGSWTSSATPWRASASA